MRLRFDRQPVPTAARVFMVLVAVIGNAVAVWSARDIFLGPFHRELFSLAALVIVAGWLAIPLPDFREGTSIADSFVLIGALTLGASAGALFAVAETEVLLIRSWRFGRPPSGLQTAFRFGAAPLAIWLAAQAAGLRGAAEPGSQVLTLRLVATIAILTLVYFVVLSSVLAIAAGLQKRVSAVRLWNRNFRELAGKFAAGAAIAGLVISRGRVDFSIMLLALPLLMVIHAAYTWRTKLLLLTETSATEGSRVL